MFAYWRVQSRWFDCRHGWFLVALGWVQILKALPMHLLPLKEETQTLHACRLGFFAGETFCLYGGLSSHFTNFHELVLIFHNL